MMHVQLSTYTLGVSFHHVHYPEPQPVTRSNGKEAKAQGHTVCKLFKVPPKGQGERELLAEEVTFCSVLDVFKKEEARKIALQRAVDDADLSKEDRTRLWKAYFERRRGHQSTPPFMVIVRANGRGLRVEVSIYNMETRPSKASEFFTTVNELIRSCEIPIEESPSS